MKDLSMAGCMQNAVWDSVVTNLVKICKLAFDLFGSSMAAYKLIEQVLTDLEQGFWDMHY